MLTVRTIIRVQDNSNPVSKLFASAREDRANEQRDTTLLIEDDDEYQDEYVKQAEGRKKAISTPTTSNPYHTIEFFGTAAFDNDSPFLEEPKWGGMEAAHGTKQPLDPHVRSSERMRRRNRQHENNHGNFLASTSLYTMGSDSSGAEKDVDYDGDTDFDNDDDDDIIEVRLASKEKKRIRRTRKKKNTTGLEQTKENADLDDDDSVNIEVRLAQYKKEDLEKEEDDDGDQWVGYNCPAFLSAGGHDEGERRKESKSKSQWPAKTPSVGDFSGEVDRVRERLKGIQERKRRLFGRQQFQQEEEEIDFAPMVRVSVTTQ
jgi:hypothetical protein